MAGTTHTFAYKICMALININRTEGLSDKVDAFFATNRITMEELVELTGFLSA